MPKGIQTKSTFGTVTVNNFSPPLPEVIPKGINIRLSFEEALQLQLNFNQLLLKLNTYNHNTKAGREACVNLCLFRDVHSITVNEGKLGERRTLAEPKTTTDLKALLEEYNEEVERSGLEQNTMDTYILHAMNFVPSLAHVSRKVS